MLSGGSTIASLLFMLCAGVPNRLAPGTSFLEASFFMNGGGRGAGWFQDDSSTLHLLCTSFLLLSRQLQSGIRSDSRGWGPLLHGIP